MKSAKTKTTDDIQTVDVGPREEYGRRQLFKLSVLTNVGLFAVINIVLVALVTVGSNAVDPARSAYRTLQGFIWTNAVAAIVAAISAPKLLSAFDKMQQRLARQNNELRSLHAIDTAISSELNLNAILQVAVRHATLAVDGEFGALWLFAEPDRASAAAQAFYNIPISLQSLVKEVVVDRAAASPRQTDAAQRRRDLEATWATDQATAALKIRNLITIPIKQQENFLGVLLVANRSELVSPPQGFTVEDEYLLNAVATTVAVAVQNSRLYQETERRGGMLRSLVARIGDAIAASSDASLLMQVLADEAARILGCVRVAIYEFDDTQEQFMPLAATDELNRGRSSVDIFFRQPLSMDIMLPPEEPSPGNAGQSQGGVQGEPRGEYRIGQVNHYVDSIRDTLGLSAETGQFLARPGFLFVLRSRDHHCIGLLCMLDRSSRIHSEEAWAFAHALASQAAVALENARLSERTHALLAQAGALQEATRKIAAELSIDKVLQGVMDSARGVLAADGYAIWDLDNESGRWIKRAGYGVGFEEEQTAVKGIPREVNVLERVLGEKTPLVIANTAHSPMAADLYLGGVRSVDGGRGHVRALLALPLAYGGKTTGVMALYYRSPQTFIPAAVDLAQSFAHQAANALENARIFTELRILYAREKRIAGELQRSLLPPIPPKIGQFDIASRYQAGLDEAAVGGDFLDLFFLTPQTIGLVIADVSGKGLPAAVQTAMIKYTLRAFAGEIPDSPADVLRRVNNVLCNSSNAIQGFVTLFYGVLDTQTGLLTYANAGHELPLLCDSETGLVCGIPLADGIALGCMPNMDFQNQTVTFDPGNQILLYTDGLTEARNPDMEFLGIDGLRQVVTCAGDDVEVTIQEIYDRVKDYSGDILRDDVAMLLVRREKTRLVD